MLVALDEVSDLALQVPRVPGPQPRAFLTCLQYGTGMQTLTLGPAGTYSHRAARAVDADVDFRQSVSAVVTAGAAGEATRGVVPVENSIEGGVTESLDALATHEVAIVREIVTPIRHALVGREGAVDVVASHPQALSQCREFLDREHPDAERAAVASTAAGVDRARAEAGVAAIAHPEAADGTDLSVLAADVQDRDSNATRFVVLGPLDDRSAGGGKTSLIVYPNANYPGLLLDLLEPFADREINLTRVESRPSGERLGDYVFHVDVAAGLYEERTHEAVAAVEAIASDGWVKRFGSYDTEHVV
jgi:prephenate dehydratase